jgi:hypothetical protein
MGISQGHEDVVPPRIWGLLYVGWRRLRLGVGVGVVDPDQLLAGFLRLAIRLQKRPRLDLVEAGRGGQVFGRKKGTDLCMALLSGHSGQKAACLERVRIEAVGNHGLEDGRAKQEHGLDGTVIPPCPRRRSPAEWTVRAR